MPSAKHSSSLDPSGDKLAPLGDMDGDPLDARGALTRSGLEGKKHFSSLDPSGDKLAPLGDVYGGPTDARGSSTWSWLEGELDNMRQLLEVQFAEQHAENVQSFRGKFEQVASGVLAAASKGAGGAHASGAAGVGESNAPTCMQEVVSGVLAAASKGAGGAHASGAAGVDESNAPTCVPEVIETVAKPAETRSGSCGTKAPRESIEEKALKLVPQLEEEELEDMELMRERSQTLATLKRLRRSGSRFVESSRAMFREMRSHPWRAFERSVKSNAFEAFFMGIIILNALVLAYQVELSGIVLGHQLEVKGYSEEASLSGQQISESLQVADRLFTVLFVIEMLLRMLAYGPSWLCSLWNYFDLFVVIAAVSGWVAADEVTVDPMGLRLVRLCRMMRLARVLRSQKLLHSLNVLVVSLWASTSMLLWSLCFLCGIQAFAAILLCQVVHWYLATHEVDAAVQVEAFRYYGTMWRALLTMFEVFFANWAPPCRVLFEGIDEWFGLFFLVYRCMLGFAVLSVVQAVFIQQTMKAVQQDLDFMMSMKQREKKTTTRELLKIFLSLDDSGDGMVSWEEFEAHLNQPHVKLLLSTLDVKVRDLSNLFYLLDDGDGQLGPGEFINGLQSLKGQAQALDLFTALQLLRRLERKMDFLADAVQGNPRRRDLRSYAVGSNSLVTARFLVPGVLTPTARRRESGLR